MVFAGLCLTCDQPVVTERHGNLVVAGGLRARVERVVGGGVGGTARCVSLCGECEEALDMIEEYYRHVDSFRETFAHTLTKYGETLTGTEEHTVTHIEGGDVPPGQMVPSTWTICLQAGDGSLVPLQEGMAPLVMAEDHQMVLETVTVESTENPKSLSDEPRPDGDPAVKADNDPAVNTDNASLHPSILDHTGMALPNEVTSDQTPAEAIPRPESPLPKPLFICARCNSEYEEADDLVAHERAAEHFGGYNYKCGICGNVYARLTSLRDHMCRHTGEKPHQCNVCGEAFSFRNQLSRHRTTHYSTPQETNQELALAHAHEAAEGDGVVSQDNEEGPELIASTSETKKNMSSELQNMLSSCEFQMVENTMGRVSVVARELLGPDSHTCPKCREMLPSQTALQRHQCPAFSSSLQYLQYSCLQCSAAFCKRSLLERHRCPSLIYRSTQSATNTPKAGKPAELVIAEDDNANTPEVHEMSDAMVVEQDMPSIVDGGVDVSGDDTQQINGESIAENLAISNGAFDCDNTEVSPIVTVSTDKGVDTETEEHHTLTIAGEGSSGEESKVSVHSQDAPSLTRRSDRNAGKVNPILEMLKKKLRTKAVSEKVEAVTDEKTADDKCTINSASSIPTSDSHSQLAVDDRIIVHPSEGETVADSEGPGAGEVSGSQDVIEQKLTMKEESLVVKRKRGRPAKVKHIDSPDTPKMNDISKSELCQLPLKKRGRPRKLPISPAEGEDCEDMKIMSKVPVKDETTAEKDKVTTIAQMPGVKRKPGRPRKTPIKDSPMIISEQCGSSVNNGTDEMDMSRNSPVKSKVGRPRIVLIDGKHVRLEEDLVEEGEKENREGQSKEGEKENQGVGGRPRRVVKRKVFVGYTDHATESEGESDSSVPKLTEDLNQEAEEPKLDETMSNEDEVMKEFVGKKGERIRKSWSKFKCNACDRYFSSQVALDKHENTAIHKRSLACPISRSFTCKVCGRGFMKLEHLRDHSVNHSKVKRFECVVCNRKFKFRSQLALHKNSAHSQAALAEAIHNNPLHQRRYRNSHPPRGDDEQDPKFHPEIVEDINGDKVTKRYRCKHCMMGFSELRLFNRHIISHFSVKPFKCDICSKEFARADTLRGHKKLHYFGYQQTTSGALLCDTCGRQFTKEDSLRNHLKMHYEHRPWSCEVCGKGFVDKHTLSRHMVIHQIQKPWLCATCGRGFNRRSHLESHEAQHTGKNLYKCEVCQRGFSDQGNLGRHMLVHSDVRPWSCSICGDTFKRKGNLDEHELTHNSERQAVCDVCGARFTTKRYLRIHQLIHSGDRPHKCSVCAATFRQLSALITHRRLHTGESPYKCLHCGKCFKYYDQWKAHEYAHTDAKPYKCMLCSATYRQAGSLRQHRKVVHGTQKGMVYLCTVCNKTFASTMSLERHMKKVHGAEATLQSLQAIGQAAMGAAARHALEMSSAAPNIVQITNPQGNIETIELANPTNIVQLLNGQTLDNLTQQGSIPSQIGLQLADGQRIVHMVGQLQDGGTQVMEVSGGERQVISIDSMGNLTDHQGAVLTDHQGTVMTNEQVTVMTDQQGTLMTDHQGTIMTDQQGDIISDQPGPVMADQSMVITEEGTVITDDQGCIIVDPQGGVMTDEVTVLADQRSVVVTDSQVGIGSDSGTVLHYSPSIQQAVVQITDSQAFVNAVSQMECTQTHTEMLTSVPEHHMPEQLHEMQAIPVSSDGVAGLSCMELAPMTTMEPIDHQQIVSSSGRVSIEVVPIETTVTTLETSEDSSQLVSMETQDASETIHQLAVDSDVIMDTPDCEVITEPVTQEVTKEEVVETVPIHSSNIDSVPNGRCSVEIGVYGH